MVICFANCKFSIGYLLPGCVWRRVDACKFVSKSSTNAIGLSYLYPILSGYNGMTGQTVKRSKSISEGVRVINH